MKNTIGKILGWEENEGKRLPKFTTYTHTENTNPYKSSELILSQISDPINFSFFFTLRRALEKLTIYEYFDTSLKSNIRQPSSYGTETRLTSNGENLMSIFLKLKNEHSLEYDKIEQALRKVNPNFKDIGFNLIGSKVFLVLREKLLSKSISIEHISDGTLRYLILLSIFLNPERGNLICIDEPEMGLHPDMIHSIAEIIKSTSKNSQLIIATHSPLLLNEFEIDEVLIFEKDADNQTTVTTKSEEDFAEWNDNYLVGQLWLRGLIGGKRW